MPRLCLLGLLVLAILTGCGEAAKEYIEQVTGETAAARAKEVKARYAELDARHKKLPQRSYNLPRSMTIARKLAICKLKMTDTKVGLGTLSRDTYDELMQEMDEIARAIDAFGD